MPCASSLTEYDLPLPPAWFTSASEIVGHHLDIQGNQEPELKPKSGSQCQALGKLWLQKTSGEPAGPGLNVELLWEAVRNSRT